MYIGRAGFWMVVAGSACNEDELPARSIRCAADVLNFETAGSQ
jgi:hypothetical protein